MKKHLFILLIFLSIALAGCTGDDVIINRNTNTTTIINSTTIINETTYVNTTINNTYYVVVSNSTIQCNGTDKLSNVSIINGNITGICTTDTGGSVNGTSVNLDTSFINNKRIVTNESIFSEQLSDYMFEYSSFCSATAGAFGGYLFTAIGSGTFAVGTGEINHPCVSCINGATSQASTGGVINIGNTNALRLAPGYYFMGSIKMTTNSFNNSIRNIFQFGFGDVATGSLIVDGAIGNATQINNTHLNITIRTANSSSYNNGTSFAYVENNTWTSFYINVTGINSMRFLVVNNNSGVIIDEVVNGKVPTAIGRETSVLISMRRSGNFSAQIIGCVDYALLSNNIPLNR